MERKRPLERLGRSIENWSIALVLLSMLVLSFLRIALRNTTGGGFVWMDELLRLLLFAVAIAGAVAASRDDKHIALDVVSHILPYRAMLLVRVITDLFTTVVMALAASYALQFFLLEKEFGSLILGYVPAWTVQWILPAGFAAISWRYFVFFIKHSRALLCCAQHRPQSS